MQRLILASLLLTASGPSCAHVRGIGGKEVAKEQSTGRSVTEAELKADLQRFTQTYFDRSAEALERMEVHLPSSLRADLLRRLLIYDSSALSIASGPLPAVNLLDMLVFTRLTRESFESHWMPRVFGEAGEPLLNVLREAEADIWSMSSKVLSPQNRADLSQMVETWQRANPDRTRVELVRFDQFSKLVGDDAIRKTTSGALGSVRAMGHAADAAVLLGERAMFLGQFMPTLLRLQARLGALEMYSDGASFLSSHGDALGRTEQLLVRSERLLAQTNQLAERIETLEPLVEQGTALASQLERMAHEAQKLTESLGPITSNLEPLLAARTDAAGRPETALESVLQQSNQLSERSLNLLREVRQLVPSEGREKNSYSALASDISRGARRIFWYLVLLGVAWTTLFWGGYYLVRRRMERPRAQPRSGGHGGHAGPRPSSVS